MPYAQLPGLLKPSLWLQHLLDFACILHYITLHCNIIMYSFLPLETHSLTFSLVNQLVQLPLQDLIGALPQSRLLCPLRAGYHPAL